MYLWKYNQIIANKFVSIITINATFTFIAFIMLGFVPPPNLRALTPFVSDSDPLILPLIWKLHS